MFNGASFNKFGDFEFGWHFVAYKDSLLMVLDMILPRTLKDPTIIWNLVLTIMKKWFLIILISMKVYRISHLYLFQKLLIGQTMFHDRSLEAKNMGFEFD